MKIRQQFKVPEKRMWHIEVSTLARKHAWIELAALVAGKKGE